MDPKTAAVTKSPLAGVRETLELLKQAFQPMMDPAMAAGGGAPPPVDPATGMPMDPAAMGGGGMPPPAPGGGAPPMDPAAMGGAPPAVDPATGMPMDPAMMGGAPPPPPSAQAPAPPAGIPPELEEILGQIAEAIDQIGQLAEAANKASEKNAQDFVATREGMIELETRLDILEKELMSPAPAQGFPSAEPAAAAAPAMM